jgi:hypothetical protein
MGQGRNERWYPKEAQVAVIDDANHGIIVCGYIFRLVLNH